jgi:Rrf2 family protein
MKGLSQKSKYALRALQRLAREKGRGPVLIVDLAKREAIPRKFLEFILLALKNAGVLSSKRGKGGGYELQKDPTQITIGEVVRLFDGPLAPLPCASERAFRKCDDCHDVATCGTQWVMREVRDAMAKILDHTTLADLTRRVDQAISEKAREAMYHI